MDYDFRKQESGMGKIVFALALDRKKMTERIVIGEMSETRRHLEDGTGNIYFDQTRPLGTLLIDFESDAGREWNQNLMCLSESYGKGVLFEEESAVELWYPALKRSFEYVVASASFLPLIAYYLHKIEEWGFVFGQCKVCGNDFLARSRHYELCSDECRKKQAVEAKREFDERAWERSATALSSSVSSV